MKKLQIKKGFCFKSQENIYKVVDMVFKGLITYIDIDLKATDTNVGVLLLDFPDMEEISLEEFNQPCINHNENIMRTSTDILQIKMIKEGFQKYCQEVLSK